MLVGDVAMGIDGLRDIVIVVSGAIMVVVVLFIGALLFLLYRRIKSILDAAGATTKMLHDISSRFTSDIVEPLTGVSSFAQGVRQGMETASKIFGKKEEGEDDG